MSVHACYTFKWYAILGLFLCLDKISYQFHPSTPPPGYSSARYFSWSWIIKHSPYSNMASKWIVVFLNVCFQTMPVCLVSWGSQQEMPWANGPSSPSSPGLGRTWVDCRGLRSAQTKHWWKTSARWVSDQHFNAFFIWMVIPGVFTTFAYMWTSYTGPDMTLFSLCRTSLKSSWWAIFGSWKKTTSETSWRRLVVQTTTLRQNRF